ncbi:hypothetical protein ADUPG1_009177, partial [Aduncisulcus paluster]
MVELYMDGVSVDASVSFAFLSDLTTLSLAGSLSDVSILSIHNAFPVDTLTSLTLDDNSIFDISVLITDAIFPSSGLISLSVADNDICDINNVVSTLKSYFTNLSVVTSSSQVCQCSSTASFVGHKTCRPRSDSTYQVECWNGYYLNKDTNMCVSASTSADLVSCAVCEAQIDVISIMGPADTIICGAACPDTYYGDDCTELCPLGPDGYSCGTGGTCQDDHTCLCFESAYKAKGLYCIPTSIEDCACGTNEVCVEDENEDIVCVCDDTWYGEDCLIACPIGDNLSVCSGYGECNDSEHVCECDSDWYGDDCSSECPIADDNVCSGESQGSCDVEDHKCVCENSWYGSDCASACPVVDDEICSGADHGTCNTKKHSCVCSDTWYGDDCSSQCPFNSDGELCGGSDFGSCDTDTHSCSCVDGYHGDVCQYVTIEDDNLRSVMCLALDHDSSCDDIVPEELLNIVSIETSGVDSFVGISKATNLEYFSIDGSVNATTTLGSQDIDELPSSVHTLILKHMILNIVSNVSSFSILVKFVLEKKASFSPSIFPTNILSLDLTGCTGFSESIKFPSSLMTLVLDDVDVPAASSFAYLLDLSSLSLDSSLNDLSILSSSNVFPMTSLTSLNIANNAINDISLLITGDFLPASDILTSLDLSDNLICDVDGVAAELQLIYPNATFVGLSASSNTCMCEESFDFTDHKTCRIRSDGLYQVECWNGYYLDKNTNTCVKACPVGYGEKAGVCVTDPSVETSNSLLCATCESSLDVMCIMGVEGVECGDACSQGFFGNLCDKTCPISENGEVCNGSYGTCDESLHTCTCAGDVYGDACEYVPLVDDLKEAICSALGFSLYTCENLTTSDMLLLESLTVYDIESYEGLDYATNLDTLSINGSNGLGFKTTQISQLPSCLTELSIVDNAGISADTDFSSLTSLTHLSLRDNSAFTFSSSGLLPASLTSLDVSNTLVTDPSVLPLGLVELSMDDVGLSGDVDFSSFTLLETLSVVDNTAFTISSSDVFPSSLLSLDISGCTSITDISKLPSSL